MSAQSSGTAPGACACATDSQVHHLLGRPPDPPHADQRRAVLGLVHDCRVYKRRLQVGKRLSRGWRKTCEWPVASKKLSRAALRRRLACSRRQAWPRPSMQLPHQVPCEHQQSQRMASNSQIPNLKTLLGNPRGGGLRGRGRGRRGIGGSSEETQQIRDNAVKATDQDAAGSRASCVELGYLHDPYAKLFATQLTTRRLPLLNRGRTLITYTSRGV